MNRVCGQAWLEKRGRLLCNRCNEYGMLLVWDRALSEGTNSVKAKLALMPLKQTRTEVYGGGGAYNEGNRIIEHIKKGKATSHPGNI